MQNIFAKITLMGFVIVTMASLLQVKNAAADNPRVALVTTLLVRSKLSFWRSSRPRHVKQLPWR